MSLKLISHQKVQVELNVINADGKNGVEFAHASRCANVSKMKLMIQSDCTCVMCVYQSWKKREGFLKREKHHSES